MLRRAYTATNGFTPYTLADVQEAIRAYAAAHEGFGPTTNSGDVVIKGHRTNWHVVGNAACNKRIPGAEEFSNLQEIVRATGFEPEPRQIGPRKLELTADQVEERQLQWKRETGSYATYASGRVFIAGVWTTWESIEHSFRAAHNPEKYHKTPIRGGEAFKNLNEFTDHIIKKHLAQMRAPPVKGTVYVANGTYNADFLEQCARRHLANGGKPEDFQHRTTILDAETGLTVGETTTALRDGKVNGLGEDEYASTYLEFLKDRDIVNVPEEPETPELAAPAHA